MAKKPPRVHVECATPRGWRDFKRLLPGGVPPIGRIDADGAIVIGRPDRFSQLLEATECRVIETLAGARRRRR